MNKFAMRLTDVYFGTRHVLQDVSRAASRDTVIGNKSEPFSEILRKREKTSHFSYSHRLECHLNTLVWVLSPEIDCSMVN
jgi:hypothetical protein